MVLAVCTAAHADIALPPAQAGGYGSDGALTVSSNTTINLSLAPTGTWDQNNSANAGKGIYDPTQWAVVFKYSSVTINANDTLKFKNNATTAPVVWLVNGNVTINGTIDLSSDNLLDIYGLTYDPGPGAFRGSAPHSGGFGPGGAGGINSNGSYATVGTGAAPGKTYGNSAILPLIGGSGTAGAASPGSPGGGAILIAATGTITVNGKITASDYGSGGAIRLVADNIAGSGTLLANSFGGGGDGRIRLEANTIGSGISTTPVAAGALPSATATVWPPASAASVRIVSVGSATAPADPMARFNFTADVFPSVLSATLPVRIETKNVPITATVNLRMAPVSTTPTTVLATYVSGDVNTAEWTANITPPVGSTILQVRVEAP